MFSQVLGVVFPQPGFIEAEFVREDEQFQVFVERLDVLPMRRVARHAE